MIHPPALSAPAPAPPISQRRTQESCSQIYSRELLLAKRGYPLWKPKAQGARLPVAYRREGVRIGDIGNLNDFGGFTYLFNAFHAADHPINIGRVPPDFKPLAIEEYLDVEEVADEFEPGSHVANEAAEISKSKIPYPPGQTPILGVPDDVGAGLSFVSSASQGALLILPEGGKRIEHQQWTTLYKYAAECAQSWFDYINGDRDQGGLARGLQGGLYFVTGCDKARAWGVASFQNAKPIEQPVRLEFVPSTTAIGGGGGAPKYTFSRCDFASASSDSDAEGIFGSPSGCVFLRGFKIAIRNRSKNPFLSSVEVTYVPDMNTDESLDGTLSAQHSTTNLGGYVMTSVPFRYQVYHPSDVINKWILENHDEVDVSLTHDEDWIALLQGDDQEMPNDSTMIQRAGERLKIIESEQCTFACLREISESTRPDIGGRSALGDVLSLENRSVTRLSSSEATEKARTGLRFNDSVLQPLTLTQDDGDRKFHHQQSENEAKPEQSTLRNEQQIYEYKGTAPTDLSPTSAESELSSSRPKTAPSPTQRELLLSENSSFKYTSQESTPLKESLSTLSDSTLSTSSSEAPTPRLSPRRRSTSPTLSNFTPHITQYHRRKSFYSSTKALLLGRFRSSSTSYTHPSLISSVETIQFADNSPTRSMVYSLEEHADDSLLQSQSVQVSDKYNPTTDSSAERPTPEAAPSPSIKKVEGRLNDNYSPTGEDELLQGFSCGFHDPVSLDQIQPLAGNIPHIISFPQSNFPAFHLQAMSWRHLLEVMVRMSETRMQPALEASQRNEKLHLRTVIQFCPVFRPVNLQSQYKEGHTPHGWRTLIWVTVDQGPKWTPKWTIKMPPRRIGARGAQDVDVESLPSSYQQMELPTFLRDVNSEFDYIYTVPSTQSVPWPVLPISFPDFALYLQAALAKSRIHYNSYGIGKLAFMLTCCYPNEFEGGFGTSSGVLGRSGVGGSLKKEASEALYRSKASEGLDQSEWEASIAADKSEWEARKEFNGDLYK
ncbi:hypothetical protein D9757_009688 [Collybiopsis confluens]|uniref:Uncharacterized protein n=1 Tax=Collybiopsis confluens TaxID=2823264 RepID=A0A8H5H1Z9_9AGAR|nr:hypothetical protein D9757_009688 [Collybiopsis confluens]